MANNIDLSTAIDNFQNAIYGKDVRDSLVDVAEAVEDAINDQVLVLDTTLTESGKAADAAVVGEEIDDLKSALAYSSMDLLCGVINKRSQTDNGVSFTWDGDQCTVNGANNSEDRASLNDLLGVSELPAFVVPGEKYIVKYNTTNHSVSMRIVFRDSAGTSLNKSVYITGDTEITIPSETIKWDIKLYVAAGVSVDYATVSGIAMLTAKSNKDLNDAINTIEHRLTTTQINDLTSLLDAETGSWFMTSGAKIKQLEPNLTLPLNDDTSYDVHVTKRPNSIRRYYDITSAVLGLHYRGYSNDAGTEISWYDRSYGKLDSISNEIDNLINDGDAEFECYTDFKENQYWWNASGRYSSNADLVHTQKFPIRGGIDYYCGYMSNSSCLGAFFDQSGAWIAPLLSTDITEVTPSYSGEENTYVPDDNAYAQDGTSPPVNNYMVFNKFTAPQDARYFSFNCTKTVNRYRQCISSKLILMLNGSGNYRIRPDDAFYQKYKDKKLCIIGSSTIMINRLSRTATEERYVADVTEPLTSGYIAGFQEYFKPFFAEVRGLGHSGAAFAKGRGAATGKCSIYTRICGGEENFVYNGTTYNYNIVAPDLSGYDVFFVVTKDGNGLTADTVGAYTDNTPETYSGAIRLVCERIQSQNPRAVIYFLPFQPAIVTGTRKEIRINANAQMKLLAEEQAYGWLGEITPGYSTVNFQLYSYDGTHFNCEGNRMFAEHVRQQLLGI